VLDLHSYLGLGNDPWPFWEKMYAGVEKGYLKEYGRDGKMPIPFIIWECVGFSWGMKADKAFSTESVEDYIKYTRKPTSWGQPKASAGPAASDWRPRSTPPAEPPTAWPRSDAASSTS
jgi:beta-galactosidase